MLVRDSNDFCEQGGMATGMEQGILLDNFEGISAIVKLPKQTTEFEFESKVKMQILRNWEEVEAHT